MTMCPHVKDDDVNTDVQQFLHRAAEARQLAWIRTKDQPTVDTRRYNTRRRDASFKPDDQVWVRTPIRRRGLSEKLLRRGLSEKLLFGPYKIVRHVGELDYEVMPDGFINPL